METFITGLGLSTSAGLNAYIPLIILNLAGRANVIETQGTAADILTSPITLGILIILLLIEMTADKIALVDSLNDAINTVVRPATGALLMVVSTSGLQDSVDPTVLALLAIGSGSISAGGVHVVKAGSRPIVTASTGGIGNPIVSVIEDISSLMMSLIALVLPFIILFFMTSFIILIGWWLWEQRRIDRLEARGYNLRSR